MRGGLYRLLLRTELELVRYYRKTGEHTGEIGSGLLVQVSSVYLSALTRYREEDVQVSILTFPDRVLAIGPSPAGFPQVKSVA